MGGGTAPRRARGERERTLAVPAVVVKWYYQFEHARTIAGLGAAACRAAPARRTRAIRPPGGDLGDRLKGKLAFVTAAGQGIGYAAATAMAREGATVHATDVNEAALAAFAGIPNVHTARLDVMDDAAVVRAVSALPPLDVMFNCAGWVHQGSILETSAADWDRSFALNVRAMYVAIKAALPAMLERNARDGAASSIINMASVAGSVKGIANRCAYGASKAAVIGLTKSVAADYVQKGVRCNAIAPGTVDTPSLADRINAFADPVEARKMFVARQPMGRLAKAEEIAPIVVYLASEESRFATGQVFSVDGGMTI
ncbi:MAG: SDR family oxidoreductase [Proteobacteria bacterium]|nr:SDR family oxidoreductase [Pseudomonadota bacterium]